jgi:hypothetical protein
VIQYLVGDDDVEANGAFSLCETLLFGEGESGVIAADATTDASKWLALSEIARSTTETICVAEFDNWCIREGRGQRGLVVPSRLSWLWEPDTEVALEADVAGALLMLLGVAATEEEGEAAGLVLGPGGDVESGQCALIVRCDNCRLAAGEGLVGLLLGDGQQEGRREGVWWEFAIRGDGLDNRAFLSTSDGKIGRGGCGESNERGEDSEGLHLEENNIITREA